MRLLNTTSIEVERFIGKVPPYAILSHRWEDDEVSLEDITPGGEARGRKGYRKLRLSCAMAARQGLQYIWIDTCCIDKTSSAELSEAINSMFRYYREAEACYAYLSDVTSVKIPRQFTPKDLDFCNSSWFTRGWTLQELIAPKNQWFYNRDWDYLGTKADLRDVIHYITKIPENILLGGDLTDESVSRKMSWASSRETTVPEDIAYCLLGMFNVNIPLLYGEGAENAFLRLQEAILKHTDDNSLFLWRSTEVEAIEKPFWGLLAPSPSYFSRSPDIVAPSTTPVVTNTPATLTSRGVNVEFLMAPLPFDTSLSIHSPLIFVDGGKRAYGLLLQELSYLSGQFTRVGADILLEIDNNISINKFKFPPRLLHGADLSSRLRPQNNTYFVLPSSDSYYNLEDPQAMRFYVRQNPKASPPISSEAISFYVDTTKSLPPEFSVDDWSSKWNRWEGGSVADPRPSYLLDFKTDCHSQLPKSVTSTLGWKYQPFGILQLSELLDGVPHRLALGVGLQKTSVNLLETPLSSRRPWCLIEEIRGHADNPDKVLKSFFSPTSGLSKSLTALQQITNYQYKSNGYVLSFELQIVHGRVCYLIILKSSKQNSFTNKNNARSDTGAVDSEDLLEGSARLSGLR